jgi:hypothetical protein
MFEEKILLEIAEKFLECLQEDTDDKKVVKILHLYTCKENFFYDIINCALNTLNETLIYYAEDFIKSIRYSLIQFDDGD